jgi:hypothetical protein
MPGLEVEIQLRRAADVGVRANIPKSLLSLTALFFGI